VKSWLHLTPDPLGLAQAFEAAYGFRELYMADLDAIQCKPPNLRLLSEISGSTSLSLMVDGGFRRLEEAEAFLRAGASKAVFGTETLPSLSLLKEALERFGEGRVTASLDLFKGRVLAADESLRRLKPLEAAERLEGLGVGELILLDLARVGVGGGVDFRLVESLTQTFHGSLLVGGGVRGLGDLKLLRSLGVSGVLLATALHEGKIRPKQLFEEGFLCWKP